MSSGGVAFRSCSAIFPSWGESVSTPSPSSLSSKKMGERSFTRPVFCFLFWEQTFYTYTDTYTTHVPTHLRWEWLCQTWFWCKPWLLLFFFLNLEILTYTFELISCWNSCLETNSLKEGKVLREIKETQWLQSMRLDTRKYCFLH